MRLSQTQIDELHICHHRFKKRAQLILVSKLLYDKAEGNEHAMSINEFSHYSLFPGLFIAFTYNKKQTPAFGASPAFLCILLPFLGLFGTWSNHEGSILSWCWISSLYGFLLCYRGRPRAIMSQSEEALGKLFSFPLSRTSEFRLSMKQWNDVVVVGIALFFSPFLLASSILLFSISSFVSTLYILLAYMLGDIALAMGFGLCRSKILNGIVARHSPPMRNDAAKRMEPCFALTGCVGSRLTNSKIGFRPEEQEPIRIWILTCRCFLTVGILPEVGGLIMN
ncbi:hypothetical protein MKW92_051425 [Papaver armeniacum]|nr:hypothetical protein MKW92_051425 [Papaver armeniacum]